MWIFLSIAPNHALSCLQAYCCLFIAFMLLISGCIAKQTRCLEPSSLAYYFKHGKSALQQFRLVKLGESNGEISVKVGFPEAGLN